MKLTDLGALKVGKIYLVYSGINYNKHGYHFVEINSEYPDSTYKISRLLSVYQFNGTTFNEFNVRVSTKVIHDMTWIGNYIKDTAFELTDEEVVLHCYTEHF